jgi:hypothetical protein
MSTGRTIGRPSRGHSLPVVLEAHHGLSVLIDP